MHVSVKKFNKEVNAVIGRLTSQKGQGWGSIRSLNTRIVRTAAASVWLGAGSSCAYSRMSQNCWGEMKRVDVHDRSQPQTPIIVNVSPLAPKLFFACRFCFPDKFRPPDARDGFGSFLFPTTAVFLNVENVHSCCAKQKSAIADPDSTRADESTSIAGDEVRKWLLG